MEDAIVEIYCSMNNLNFDAFFFFFFFLFCKGGVGTISNIISVRDEEEIWKMYNYYSSSNLNLPVLFLVSILVHFVSNVILERNREET